ncbi:hypothetical protein CALCODRAFT_286311 [Calocera cornea HHB12733]|uniref:Uncharacterized protein n=1 Tax=Calocera cornea HHB12733 TaxID=1353952 RepID=A0A165FX15_9BASI|nr:hypothetical protein CALCODRAFT_286311 [Calocera cornea HHB12733]
MGMGNGAWSWELELDPGRRVMCPLPFGAPSMLGHAQQGGQSAELGRAGRGWDAGRGQRMTFSSGGCAVRGRGRALTSPKTAVAPCPLRPQVPSRQEPFHRCLPTRQKPDRWTSAVWLYQRPRTTLVGPERSMGLQPASVRAIELRARAQGPMMPSDVVSPGGKEPEPVPFRAQ